MSIAKTDFICKVCNKEEPNYIDTLCISHDAYLCNECYEKEHGNCSDIDNDTKVVLDPVPVCFPIIRE